MHLLHPLSFLSILSLLPILTAAHSHISHLIIDGLLYPGFTPRASFSNGADVAAWNTTVYDDGFVSPSRFNTSDVVCAANAISPQAHIPVRPGAKIHLQWNGWPASHHGPILTYLASCLTTATTTGKGKGKEKGDDATMFGCWDVEKEDLEFFKIDEQGLINPSPVPRLEDGAGYWASDGLIGRNNSYMVQLPQGLRKGFYVLRHELVALHYAEEGGDGAQIYPQCFNLVVRGDEDDGDVVDVEDGEMYDGIRAQDLYDPNSDSFVVDVYNGLEEYNIPGPEMVEGAVHVDPLETSQASMRGTPVKVVDRTSLVSLVITTEDLLTVTEISTTTTGGEINPTMGVPLGLGERDLHWA